MPSYKLYYFDGRGRAELCRLLFALAGEKYEDNRLTSEQWKEFKPKTPAGQMPVLEVDGKIVSQSNAIATYVARQFGFYPSDNFEALLVDEIMGIITDFLSQAVKAFFAEESKKEEAMNEFITNQRPKFLTILEKKIGANGYYVGNKVTLADVAVYDLVWSMSARNDKFLDGFSKISELKDRIGALPKIKAYVDKRHSTTF